MIKRGKAGAFRLYFISSSLMKNELSVALKRIAAEKNLPEEDLLEILQSALVSAYKKDHPEARGVEVNLHAEGDQDMQVLAAKTVVEEVEDESQEIPLLIAMAYDPSAEIDSEILVDVTPQDFGRIAAQTAKQVVIQRIKELERDLVFKEYSDKIGEILSGQIRKIERGHVIINVGRSDGIMPYSEQIPGEHYHQQQRIRVLLKDVAQTSRGPQIILSRANDEFIRRLFELEIPEIYSGTVEITSVAREPGRRTKVAVAARQEGVDPVGSCVGQKGSRIQVIMTELGQEKIDIIGYDTDPTVFLANSLKPAQVNAVIPDTVNRRAVVVIPEDQLSLAIGREGQNVRLACKLTGWDIDVKSPAEAAEDIAKVEQRAESEGNAIKAVASSASMEEEAPIEVSESVESEPAVESAIEPAEVDQTENEAQGIEEIPGIGPKMAEKLIEADFGTVQDVANSSPVELSQIKGLSESKAEVIIEEARKLLG